MSSSLPPAWSSQALVCPRCNTPFVGNMAQCMRCGFVVMPAQQQVTPAMAGWRSSTGYTNHSYDGTGSQTYSWPGVSSPGERGSQPVSYTPSPQQPLTPFKSPSGVLQPPPVSTRPSSYDTRPLSSSPKSYMMLVVSIIIVVLVLISGSLFVWVLTQQQNRTDLQSQRYPTPKGSPLFADSFKDNAQQWGVHTEAGKYTMVIGQGRLQLEDTNNKLLPIFLPGNKTFDNFTLLVNASLTRGDQANGYGIYIRGATDQSGNLTSYYRFALYGDGSYAIFKGTTDASGKTKSTTLAEYTINPAIQGVGSENQIVIVADGPHMTLIINGTVIKTITDQSYSSGIIGLFVSNVQHVSPGASAKFTHLAIYPLAKQSTPSQK